MPDATTRRPVSVRPIAESDREAWLPLWEAYNAFYGRVGPTGLTGPVTDTTWNRFFDPIEPVYALIAEQGGRLVGIAHYLFHRSTSRVEPVCYLQDLYTEEALRGRGIGRALILAVYERAKEYGASRVYWQTQATNAPGRLLYDKVAKHLGFIVYSKDI